MCRFSTAQEVNAHIQTRLVYPTGGTNTHIGLDHIRTRVLGANGDRGNARNVVVVVTDGEANAVYGSYWH